MNVKPKVDEKKLDRKRDNIALYIDIDIDIENRIRMTMVMINK